VTPFMGKSMGIRVCPINCTFAVNEVGKSMGLLGRGD
jgi:hypothetical protein